MNLLTRLFVVEWFKSLVGALVSLLLLITSADIINGFLRGKEGEQVLLEWALKMPDLAGKMLPVTCLLATLFTFNRLKSHNELIATLAAGFSYTRITALIGSCSLLMVILQFANLGFLEPYANKVKRQEIKKSMVSEGKYLTRGAVDGGQFWFKSKDYFATFLTFDKKKSSLNQVRFYFFTSDGLASKVISAERADFVSDRTWNLINMHTLEDLTGNQFPRMNTSTSQSIVLQETPDDFKEFEADLTTLNWFNLSDFITKISQTGINTSEYRILLHQKIALSFSCLVFALIPLGTMYKPSRRSDSFGKNVALTLILTVAFWLLFSTALSYGQSGKIPSWLAAYIVPLGFMAHAIRTFWHNRKLAF
jgi:lipopolysaccharide export system permease protein